jgi:hypothetical protein
MCAVVGLVAGAGCGTGNSLAPANISGGVTYNGKNVPGGVVKFIAPDGSQYTGDIGPDGTYAVADVPVGELIIVVDNSNLDPSKNPTAKSPDAARRASIQGQQPPAGMGAGPTGTGADDRKFIKIPEKYSNSKKSPLTLTVKAGRQVHNIELTD